MKIVGRVVLILTCLFFSYQLLFTSSHWIFVDYFNLLIHEAGHLIFMFFGQFLDVLAGSLLQILLPCIFLVYFLKRKEYFSVFVMLFWIADNIISVSVYIKDAIVMQLPLLGGDGSIHDWNYLLSSMGLLPFSEIIGGIFNFFGTICLLISLLGMIIFTILDYKTRTKQ